MVDLITSLSALQGRYLQLGAQMSDPEVIAFAPLSSRTA